jgi:hypothetical protein
MVVILPKDSLYFEKMTGIVNMGDLISKLFKELKKNTLGGITLLFNKFTQKKDIM